ncbi:MAG TPA: hypothetical protein VHV55_25560 [Pirellulales bacterium]|jgi:hypothetical protein|nr:hypothetical protein [Pirellulales bacterium]
MDDNPRRRWFTWRLRTLFLVTAVAAVDCWIGRMAGSIPIAIAIAVFTVVAVSGYRLIASGQKMKRESGEDYTPPKQRAISSGYFGGDRWI